MIILTGKIPVRRRIFQGDSSSPLLFCMCLMPLTNELNSTGMGYKVGKVLKHEISHLFYMDDLKLYARNDDTLKHLLQIFANFSEDICMDLSLEKCAKATLRRGRQIELSNVEICDNVIINDLELEKTYKYLGIAEGNGIQQEMMKTKLRKEFIRRARLILESELNGSNKVLAIKSFTVPVIQYSFGILNWK
jgi:predicted Zn-dependent protease with MMP-like domain